MGDLIRIGADIGQRVDPTAFAVIEEHPRGDGVHYLCRAIERLPLGTPYPKVADRLVGVARYVRMQAEEEAESRGRDEPRQVQMVVDATGVGTPVVDLLRERGEYPLAAFFTHGDKYTRNGNQVAVGKTWMVSRLQALFQSDRIHLGRTAETDALREELLDYEIRIDERANDRYGAFRTGAHDDLVTALGLAVGPGDSMRGFGVSSWLPDGDDDNDDDARAWLQ